MNLQKGTPKFQQMSNILQQIRGSALNDRQVTRHGALVETWAQAREAFWEIPSDEGVVLVGLRDYFTPSPRYAALIKPTDGWLTLSSGKDRLGAVQVHYGHIERTEVSIKNMLALRKRVRQGLLDTVGAQARDWGKDRLCFFTDRARPTLYDRLLGPEAFVKERAEAHVTGWFYSRKVDDHVS